MNQTVDEKPQSAIPTPHSDIEHSQSDHLLPLVARVMRIDETTWGTTEQRFLVRYRGQLLLDSEMAYDQLAEALRPHRITPLFRIDDDVPTILLMDVLIEPKPSKA